MSPTRDTLWLHGKQVTVTVNTSVNAPIDAPKTNLRQYIRAGGGFVGIHNAFGTEYNWPWYEGLLGNANYYDHGANQNGDVVVVNADPSTAGAAGEVAAFRDEFYNLVPYPTKVKFLATRRRDTLGDAAHGSPGTRQFPPGHLVPVLRRRPRLADDDGPRLGGVHPRLGLPGAGGVPEAGRAGHQVGDGPDAVLHLIRNSI